MLWLNEEEARKEEGRKEKEEIIRLSLFYYLSFQQNLSFITCQFYLSRNGFT